MEKRGLVDMESSGKSLAIPCTSRGTLEKLFPVGIQVFIDAAASPVPSTPVHGAPGPPLQLVPPGFLHHLRGTLRGVHKVGKILLLIKNLLRFKCLLFLPSKNLSFQPLISNPGWNSESFIQSHLYCRPGEAFPSPNPIFGASPQSTVLLLKTTHFSDLLLFIFYWIVLYLFGVKK